LYVSVLSNRAFMRELS